MESTRGATDLDGGEGRDRSRRGKEVACEESDGPDEMIPEATDGEDLDRDGGGLAGEEVRSDFEEELVVPGWILASNTVGSGLDLVVRVDPDECIGLHAA